MTLVSRRLLAAVAVLATLAAAGCAVPGQGSPGTAATYGGREVTDQQVIDFSRGFLDLGTAAADPGTSLTLLLLGPEIVDNAAKLGFVATDDDVTATAEAWIAFDGNGGEATPAALEITRDAMALDFLVRLDAGAQAVHQLGYDAESAITANPRYGAFTGDRFWASVNDVVNKGVAASTGSDTWFFTVFGQVSGFTRATPDWVSSGG
jgi:hypothetical protein